MLNIVLAVGARPNFVKMAPVIEAFRDVPGCRQLVVHTGQHYDERMSDEILADLGLPAPDIFLGVGSGAHGAQTGKALIAFEQVLLDASLRPRCRRRGCQFNAGVRASRLEARHPGCRMSKRVFARPTGRCPRRSTAC